MKNTFGNSVSVTLFGESHGKAIGVVIDGLAPGMTVDTDFISKQLSRRRPQGNISTPRKEKDEFEILSGVFEGKTTGTPICIVIPNVNTKSIPGPSAAGIVPVNISSSTSIGIGIAATIPSSSTIISAFFLLFDWQEAKAATIATNIMNFFISKISLKLSI